MQGQNEPNVRKSMITDDDVLALTDALHLIRNAICRPAVAWETPHGGYVGDLTESIVYMGTAIDAHAASLESIADAIREVAISIDNHLDSDSKSDASGLT